MTVFGVELIQDGVAVEDGVGLHTITASPWTLRLIFGGDVKEYLVGFFDTQAHGIAAIAAAQTAGILTGAAVTTQTVQTWMGTTSPQAGFVTTRTSGGQPIPTDLYSV